MAFDSKPIKAMIKERGKKKEQKLLNWININPNRTVSSPTRVGEGGYF